MTQQNVAVPGSQTFVHGTVLSVLFNTQVAKRAGGTYEGTTLNFQTTQGQSASQSWATSVVDDARNIEIRNALIQLQTAPGAQFTLHKTKNEKGFWNVDKIEFGFVEGVRTIAAPAPVLAGAPLAAPSNAYVPNDSSKMRSKEQCIRGEAIQAAASIAKVGGNGQVNIEGVIQTAEVLANYITNGVAAPVTAPIAQAPVVAPVVAPVAVVPAVAPVVVAPVVAPALISAAPIPDAPVAAVVPAVAALAPAPAPVVSAPPVVAAAPVVAAQPRAAFDDGFGGPPVVVAPVVAPVLGA